MPLRILIAEDNSAVRKGMKALLEVHPDWQVCGEASNGLEAVQKAAELKPDVAVLDLAMPEMDGLEAASQISSASPEVPILIYTNLAVGPEAKLEAKKYGVREIINKGAAPEQLVSAVEALIKPPAVAAEAATAATATMPETDARESDLPPDPRTGH
jgi:DNA-binding NarL/FixJ family response regulator